MNEPIRVSSFLGPTGRGPADDLPIIEFCIEHAIDCDRAGFAVVNLGEQHFNNYEPYSTPYMLGSLLAPNLRQAYIGTTVVPLVFYHPMRFASQSSVLDLLTRGRLVLGLSSGANPIVAKGMGFPNVDTKKVFAQKLDVALKAWAKRPEDPPLVYKTDFEEGVLPTRLMPLPYRNPHPLLAIGTNTDATIIETAKRGWPVFFGRYNHFECARKMRLYRETLLASGHSAEVVAECLAHTNYTKSIVIAETDEAAWKLAEKQLRGFMNFTFSVGTGRTLSDDRSMKQLWDAKIEGPVDISIPPFTPEEWIQASAMVGSPESIARQIREYAEAGLPHLNARFVFGDFDPVVVREMHQLFCKEVMPKLQAQGIAPPRADQIRPEHRGDGKPAVSLAEMFKR